MIRSSQAIEANPREALAQALGGTLIGRDTILVGGRLVWCSLAGVVRTGGIPLGTWSDDTAVLAAAYRAAVES